MGYGQEETLEQPTRDLNQALIKLITKNITSASSGTIAVADFASVIEPRAFGTNRIKGDITNHIGVHAIIIHIQMLADVVEEQVLLRMGQALQ